jgi:hypothetical protein
LILSALLQLGISLLTYEQLQSEEIRDKIQVKQFSLQT